MGTGCCDVFGQGQPNPNEGESVASPAGTCECVYIIYLSIKVPFLPKSTGEMGLLPAILLEWVGNHSQKLFSCRKPLVSRNQSVLQMCASLGEF